MVSELRSCTYRPRGQTVTAWRAQAPTQVLLNGQETLVGGGLWVVTNEAGDRTEVWADEQFRLRYEPVEDE